MSNEQVSNRVLRDRIRSQIRPFPHEVRYATGWAGTLTFKEISETLSPLMARKLAKWGMYGQDIPDSLQTGLMRLWQHLVEQPDLLARDGKSNAMWRALAKCNGKYYMRQNERYLPFTDLEGEETLHGGSGVSTNGRLHERVLEILRGG